MSGRSDHPDARAHAAAGEHGLVTFMRIRRRLNDIEGTMKVSTGGTLVTALDRLSCAPSVTMALSYGGPTAGMRIADTPAGDLKDPNVQVILDNSTFSSFGKGDKTVVDPAYRTGREIPAANIQFPSVSDHQDNYGDLISSIEDRVGEVMFVGRMVSLKFHKLVVYEPGGHFDWHMDSTHNDKHHATVLVALNTSWKGGDLILKRNGNERRVNMQTSEKDVGIKAVGFYTDTEHKVEPVTEGVRIVLQYDVEVAGWLEPGTAADREEDDDEMEVDGSHIRKPTELYLDNDTWRRRKDERAKAKAVLADASMIESAAQIIESFLDPKSERSHREVGFGLQHLYRRASILPIYLKGADAQLYKALTDRGLDVSLSPIVLHGVTDDDGELESFTAECYDYDPNDRSSDSDSSMRSSDATPHNPSGDEANWFYLPEGSAIKCISHDSYIEHTGNEAQIGESKYFGSGMFVRKKETASKSGCLVNHCQLFCIHRPSDFPIAIAEDRPTPPGVCLSSLSPPYSQFSSNTERSLERKADRPVPFPESVQLVRQFAHGSKRDIDGPSEWMVPNTQKSACAQMGLRPRTTVMMVTALMRNGQELVEELILRE